MNYRGKIETINDEAKRLENLAMVLELAAAYDEWAGSIGEYGGAMQTLRERLRAHREEVESFKAALDEHPAFRPSIMCQAAAD